MANLHRMPSQPSARAVPASAWGLCLAALAAPLLVWSAIGGGDIGLLGVFLCATSFVPAFVLTRHLGRTGMWMTLLGGAATVGIGAAVLAVRGEGLPDWRIAAALGLAFVGVTVAIGRLHERIAAERTRADLRDQIDALTALSTRDHTQGLLIEAFDASRAGGGLTVALLHIDRFRMLNDEHGRLAGDRVLRTIGKLVADSVRGAEAAGRWGGAEFLLVLPECGTAEARERIEAVQARLAGADLQWQPLTFSAGVATSEPGTQSADALLSLADEALIRARSRGGDRVETSDSHDGVEAPDERAPVALPDPVGHSAHAPTTADVAARIVVIDDDKANLRAFERGLSAFGFQSVSPFSDPEAALEHIEREGVDLVLLDLHMEPLDGFGVLRRLGPTFDREGFLPVIILTGERDPKIRERALRMGGRDFLTKPIDLSELHARIQNLLETRTLHRQVRAAATSLEDRVRARTRELEEARAEILARLARAAEYRDDATGRHQERVGALSALLAGRMGLDEARIEVLRQAAPLHDVGKIGIPDSILRKPGPLTPEEYARMKQHTRLGAELLSGSTNQILETASVIAASHHERWDGSGYPAGLAGLDIPTEGRIVAVADAFDSLTHRRTYKAAVPLHVTMERLVRDAGTALDPDAADALEYLYRTGQLEVFVEATD